MLTSAKWVALGALFLIPFIPLYVAGELFFPFITGKAFLFRILVEIGFAAWIALAVSDAKYRPKFSWILAISGAFVLWMFLADAFSPNAQKALWSNFERMDGFVTLIHVFAFMVFSSAMLSAHKLWDKWWLTFLGGAALVVGYGLFQSAGLMETHQGSRVDASFGNAAYLPAYLLFCIAVALWQAFVQKGWLRYALLTLAALASLIVIFSATRGAFVGLIGGAVIGGFIWLVTDKGTGRKAAIGVLVGVLLVLGGLFAIRDASFIEGSQTLTRLTSIFDISSLEVRGTIWSMALQGAAERPIMGWGQEGFSYVFAKYYDPALYAQEPWFDRAHNVFLDWLIAGGVPALLLFLALLGSIVVGLYRGPFTKLERVMLIGALVAYSIQGLAVFDNLFTYVPLFAIVGMVHARVARDIPALARVPANKEAINVAAPVAFVIAIALVWTVNVPSILAGTELINALSARTGLADSVRSFEQAIARNSLGTPEIREHLVLHANRVSRANNVPDADKRAILTLAATEIMKEVEQVPGDTRLRFVASDALSAIGDFQGALAQVETAITFSPKKQTSYLQLGSIAWQVKDYARAREAFRTAYELDPSFPVLAAYAAAGEILVGNNEAADALLTEAYGTPLVDLQFLRLAYFETKQYGKLVALGKKTVEDSGGSPDSRLNYALLLAVAGRVAEARAEIDATVVAYPEVATDAATLLRQIEAGIK